MFEMNGIVLLGLHIQYETILYVCVFAALAADITADIMKQKISRWWVTIVMTAIVIHVYFTYGTLTIIVLYVIVMFITLIIQTMALLYVIYFRKSIFSNLENKERNILINNLYGLGILKAVLWPIMQFIPGLIIPKNEKEKEKEK